MDNLGNELYSDSAKLGYFKSLISLIIAIVIGTVLIICSIQYFTSTDIYKPIKASIINANCINKIVNNKSEINCNLQLQYIIEKTEYNGNLSITSTLSYTNGQIIDIEYNQNDPTKIRTIGLSSNTIGLISLCVAIILIGGAYFNYYLTTKYKLYASAEGIGTIYNTFK